MNNDIPIINGFSKMSRQDQEELIINTYNLNPAYKQMLASFRHPDEDLQNNIESYSENTISNYHFPLGIAPNFLINGRMYALPMLTEESSVVAAAANAAKYWARKGGFHTKVIDTVKKGQVHFLWHGNGDLLQQQWPQMRESLLISVSLVEESMKKRGGGIKEVALINKTSIMPGYFQVDVSFQTAEAMGANFINTCLEVIASEIRILFSRQTQLASSEEPLIIMSILSNYTPDCLAEATINCPLEELNDFSAGMSASMFAKKFKAATDIANIEVNRAVTHNKGIMNGVDAVVLATGNDFRAVEANAHAYAARDGHYRGLSYCSIDNEVFTFSLRLPLAIGTIGGLTSLHPLARFSMDLLGKPKVTELMGIVAAAGLASNFAAIASLITTGIQKGHMKMHLSNIINSLGASTDEKNMITRHFARRTVSVSEVKTFLDKLREN